MINLFFGQNVFISFANDREQLEYQSISGLISNLPHEIEENDYIVELKNNEQEVRYAADHTAERGTDICRPDEGDDEWNKLFYAAVGKTGYKQVESVTLGLPRYLWEHPEALKDRIREMTGIIVINGKEQSVIIKNLVTYPAMIAGIFDCILTIEDTNIKPNENMPDRFLVIVLYKTCCEWALVEGLTVLQEGMFSFGFRDVLLDIRDYYFDKTKKSLSLYETDVAYHTSTLEIKEGKFESINTLIQESTERLESKVKSGLKQLKDELKFDMAYVLGENTITFKSDEATEIVNEPEFAIVRGLHKLNLLMGKSEYVSR